MSSNGGPRVAVKLFIDKEKKRVLYAESDMDFVDILFSFLTLPLGTIVRRLGKQSQIGCLDEVYKSVENLSEDHFQTSDCQTMLLGPVNAAAFHCDQLRLKVDDADQTAIYACYRSSCNFYFSSVSGAICKCGLDMDKIMRFPQSACVPVGEKTDGVFAKSGTKFIITDDLHVAPSTTALIFSLIDKLGLEDQANIKEEVLQLNSNMIISLLRRALLSKQPLTGLYFDVAIRPNAVTFSQLPENRSTKRAVQVEPKFKQIKIRPVQTKDDSSVLYAEVGRDFVDNFFGLLCIPVGSIIKTFSQLSADGCIDNIYRSVGVCVKQECIGLLLSPKLAPFFGCSSNVLQVQELDPREVYSAGRYNYEMNPKSPRKEDETAYRAYVNGGSINFMVTNDLRIVDFSLAKSLKAIRASKIPKEKLVEKELTLDKTQVLKLLRSTLLTRDVLSSVLLPRKKHVTTSVATPSTQATAAVGLEWKGPPQLRRSSRLRKGHSARRVTRLWWNKAGPIYGLRVLCR